MDKIVISQILRGVGVAAAVIILLILLYYVIPLIYPFIIGWAIAYMLNPLVNLLHRKGRLPRWLAVTLSLLLFLSIAAAVITILIANIVIEIGDLTETIQANIDKWKDDIIGFFQSDYLQNVINQLTAFYDENPNYQETINSNLSKTTTTLADAGSVLVKVFFDVLISILKSLPTIVTVMIIALLAAFFVSKDWYRHLIKLSTLFPHQLRLTTRAVWVDLQKALFGYLRAQFVLISITACVVIIGLMILRVNYAISIGLLVGFVDLLPYLGTGVVMVPWIIIVFLQGNVSLGIGLAILYGIILVARQLMEPKVLATSVGLDPLATLIAMVVGLNLFGVLGLIIGPVILVLILAFHRAHVFRDLLRYIIKGKIRTE